MIATPPLLRIPSGRPLEKASALMSQGPVRKCCGHLAAANRCHTAPAASPLPPVAANGRGHRLTRFSLAILILDRQERHGWGGKVIDRLAVDLRMEFPGVRGFSNRNLQYMQTLEEAYPEPEFAQQAVAQIPWGHITLLLDKITDELRTAIDEGRRAYLESTGA